MRSLRHKHIVPILDYGQQGPWQYLVMPFISGGTLEDLLAEGPLSLQEAGFILAQIASALDYVHSQGIIHRDIKPANILLDKQRNVYLADFGIATVLGDESEQRTGRIKGTPIYMAPELYHGEVGTSGDIYALGVLLYEMLTGQVPFDGPDARTVCMKQVQEDVPLPSHLNPAISRAIEQVLLCALAKDPALRYDTAQIFASAYYKSMSVTPTLLEHVQAFLLRR